MSPRMLTLIAALLALSGCVTAPSVPLESLSSEQKALHDVMQRRLDALGARDAAALRATYVDGASEPQVLIDELFPALVKRDWTYRVAGATAFVMMEGDAMARFRIDGRYAQYYLQEDVAAVYERRDGVWKLSSVTLSR